MSDSFALATLAGLVAVHSAIFLPLIPATGKRLGQDYQLHLPNLLAGYFHEATNGPWSVPWFSPAKCGGVPFLADLNVGYYSAPQWLAFVIDPLAAIRVTFVLFAALGAIGAYLLARRRFALSTAAGLVAGVLFLFNGFYAYRMAIGHITFHPFALAPWLAFLVLRTPGGVSLSDSVAGSLFASIMTGAIVAYSFQAGMIHAIIPLALATVIVILVHGHLFGHRWRPWLLFAGAVVVSLALSADRLTAALAFLDHFSRDYYPLPGFPDLGKELWVALQSLFSYAPIEQFSEAVFNYRWTFERHEIEFSVGPVAAVLLLAGLMALAVGWVRGGLGRAQILRGAATAFPVAVILALPIAINFYRPDWNAFLKEFPVLSASSGLVRWFMLYIPVIVLAAALAFDRLIPPGSPRVAGAAIMLAVTIAFAAGADKSFYRAQNYDGSLILTSWRAVRTAADVPPITDLVYDKGLDGNRLQPSEGDNQLVFGGSEILCYQPMFGYRLEFFPIGNWIRPAPVSQQVGPTSLNIKNPACYVYPEENKCAPGDEFTPDQIDAAAAFVTYRPYPFEVPQRQRIAGWINLVALIAAAAAMTGSAALRLRRRLAPR